MKNIGYSSNVGLMEIEVLNMTRIAIGRKQESFFTQIVLPVEQELDDSYRLAKDMQDEQKGA